MDSGRSYRGLKILGFILGAMTSKCFIIREGQDHICVLKGSLCLLGREQTGGKSI